MLIHLSILKVCKLALLNFSQHFENDFILLQKFGFLHFSRIISLKWLHQQFLIKKNSWEINLYVHTRYMRGWLLSGIITLNVQKHEFAYLVWIIFIILMMMFAYFFKKKFLLFFTLIFYKPLYIVYNFIAHPVLALQLIFSYFTAHLIDIK